MYPLIFECKQVVAGCGFLAGVMLEGFALLDQDGGAWFVTGVQPVGITACGATEAEACTEFRESIWDWLLDCAESARGFEAFEAEVGRVLARRDHGLLQQWRAARLAFGSSGRSVGEYLSTLRRDIGALEPYSIVIPLVGDSAGDYVGSRVRGRYSIRLAA